MKPQLFQTSSLYSLHLQIQGGRLFQNQLYATDTLGGLTCSSTSHDFDQEFSLHLQLNEESLKPTSKKEQTVFPYEILDVT